MKQLQRTLFIGFDYDHFSGEQEKKVYSMCPERLFTEKLIPHDEIRDINALIVQYDTKVGGGVIDYFPNLEYIGVAATSVEKVDLDYAKKRNITVTNIPNHSSTAIAEFVFGALLSHARNLPQALKNVDEDNFNPEGLLGWELKGKTFGILGLGNIEKSVADIALGMGMNVIYNSCSKKEAYEARGCRFVSQEELFVKSDILGLFFEVNEMTRGLIKPSHIQSFKGEVLFSILHTDVFQDFNSLIPYLEEHSKTLIQTHFKTIPEAHKNIMDSSNSVELYPSIAVSTEEAKKRRDAILIENIEGFLTGSSKNKVI